MNSVYVISDCLIVHTYSKAHDYKPAYNIAAEQSNGDVWGN